MELTIVEPLKVRMPEGPQALEPGQTIDLPDKVARRLMELAPGKVRMVNDSPVHIGQRVHYCIPTNIKGPQRYTWDRHVGLVEMIDSAQHLALIIPEDETIPWRWVNLVFVNGVGAE
jgi:hypothetical protein